MTSVRTEPAESRSGGPADRVTAELAALSSGTRNWLIDNMAQLHPAHSELETTPRVKAGLELSLLRVLWLRCRPGDPELAALTELVRTIWQDPDLPGAAEHL